MAVKLAFNGLPRFEDSSGNALNGGLLFTYAAGSTTKQTTYQDSAANTQHSNPIVLNSRGEPPAAIWLTAGSTYKFVLAPSTDTDPPASAIWTVDNISGINDTTSAVDQWLSSGLTPTYVSATSFTFTGDQTAIFHVGRRLKTTNTGGTVYSTISASAYGALTTITVVNDSGTLDSGLSAVSYGVLSNTNSSLPALQAKGDLLTQSAAGTLARRAVGSNGTIPMARSADSLGFAYVAGMNKAIYGLTYANNVADATNDLDIAAGGAMDATGAYWMTLASALTKQSDAAWAVGSAAGGLDLIGSAGNNDFYIWLIARSDTGVVDALYSLSSTAPSMPTNYDFKRLIGWFKRSGGAIVAFHTYEIDGGGLEMNWDVPTLDVNLANTLTTSRRTDAIKVPLNFSVEAHVNVIISDATTNCVAWICCPDQTDAAPSQTVAPLGNARGTSAADIGPHQIKVRTSAAGLIAARSTLATVDLYAVSTMGFRWGRRN